MPTADQSLIDARQSWSCISSAYKCLTLDAQKLRVARAVADDAPFSMSDFVEDVLTS